MVYFVGTGLFILCVAVSLALLRIVYPPIIEFIFVKDHPEIVPAWVQGVGSIAAVYIAARIANRQTKTQTKIAAEESRRKDDERLRNEKSAKAVLPFALDQIAKWAKDHAMSLGNVDPGVIHPGVPFVFQPIPPDVGEILGKVVLFADESVSDWLVYLLSRMQIHVARLSDASERVARRAFVGRHNMETFLVDALEIYLLATFALPYARGLSRKIEIQIEISDFESTAAMLGISIDGEFMPPKVARRVDEIRVAVGTR